MCTSATICNDETKLLNSNLRSFLMHFHPSPKSIDLLNKSLLVMNMQEVNNVNSYQSLWFKYFMGADKDYSYFFGGRERRARTKEQNNFLNFVF